MNVTVAALILISTLTAGSRATRAEPPQAAPADDAWASTCAGHLDLAAKRLGARHRAFRGITADAVPRESPPRVTRSRTGRPLKVAPVVPRHAPQVYWSLQHLRVPEYFYVHVIDVRDDEGAWAPVAGDARWTCSTTTSRDQVNRACVQRRGERLAVVRAIYWGRSPRVVDYEAAFTAASERCLE